MLKRGQVTIFLIVGIVLLALFSVIFYLVNYTSPQELKVDLFKMDNPFAAQTRPRISSYVNDCLKETTILGAYLLGAQGGIISPQKWDTLLLTENQIINYGYLEGVNQLQLTFMEKELNSFIDQNIDNCLGNFSNFAREAMVVDRKDIPESETSITPFEIKVKLKYPFEISKDAQSYTQEDFSTEIDCPIGKFVEVANQIIEEHHSGYVQTNSNSSDFFISVFPFDSSKVIYSITTTNPQVEEPYILMFAVKDTTLNTPPKLEYVPNLVFTQKQAHTYQILAQDAEGDELTFTSSNSLFNVSKQGELYLTGLNVGTYYVNFTVTDTHGLKDSQEVRVIINP